jgi:hypothetical protein
LLNVANVDALNVLNVEPIGRALVEKNAQLAGALTLPWRKLPRDKTKF